MLRLFVVFLLFVVCVISDASAQKVDFLDTGAPLKTAPSDPQITAALRDVSPAKI